MWRSLQKQDRGAKQREQSTAIQGAKISHDGNQHAKMHSRCEFPKWPFRTPQGHFRTVRIKFRTPLLKVRKFSHRAKLPPGTRVPFRTPQPLFAPCETRRVAEETIPRTSCQHLELTNHHLAPFRPWQRLGEVFPHPHPRRCLDQSSSPLEAPLRHLLRTPPFPHLRVERTQRPGLMSRLSNSSQSSGIHSVCCRGVRNPTLIHFTIDGRQGAIGARHIAEALRIPHEPVTQADFRQWSSFS
ncbi:hypothetical protein CK203_038491 [Vitis vinifera]|uniref:Uncharacterized protein n=1 Tax=Vitis vinifera TaxID=29760 RepID=A0A438IS04_VITVI|nr:hypothetical protein CK203_038491 [Vitis vinifera]